MPLEPSCRPASPLRSHPAGAAGMEPGRAGAARQPGLPPPLAAPAASPAARPGAACQVSLAMSRVVRRSSLLLAAPQAGQPPACPHPASRLPPSRLPPPPPRGSRPWPDPARRGCRAKRPPSPPPSAPWSTTPSSGEGRGDATPRHAGAPPPPGACAVLLSHAAGRGLGDAGRPGRCGAPRAAGGAGRASARPGAPGRAFAEPPHLCAAAMAQGCPRASSRGWPLPLWRREGPWVHPEPLCPQAWCRQGKAQCQAKSCTGASALTGSWGTAAGKLPPGNRLWSAPFPPRLRRCFPLTSLTSPHPRGQAAACLALFTAPAVPAASFQGGEWRWRTAALAAPHLHSAFCLAAGQLCGPL